MVGMSCGLCLLMVCITTLSVAQIVLRRMMYVVREERGEALSLGKRKVVPVLN
jgi:hypothetical protein